jgi:SNF family Na+-dependent transporter
LMALGVLREAFDGVLIHTGNVLAFERKVGGNGGGAGWLLYMLSSCCAAPPGPAKLDGRGRRGTGARIGVSVATADPRL